MRIPFSNEITGVEDCVPVWPHGFPEGCPPTQSVPADGDFFRIANEYPPDLADFISLYDRDTERAMRNVSKGQTTLCETMGLSVYRDLKDAVACAKTFPKIGDKVYVVHLTPSYGRILHTARHGNSHHTWWVPQGVEPKGSAGDLMP